MYIYIYIEMNRYLKKGEGDGGRGTDSGWRKKIKIIDREREKKKDICYRFMNFRATNEEMNFEKKKKKQSKTTGNEQYYWWSVMEIIDLDLELWILNLRKWILVNLFIHLRTYEDPGSVEVEEESMMMMLWGKENEDRSPAAVWNMYLKK